MNIYVANLNFDMLDEDLKQFFASYGEVQSAKIIRDKTTDKSRGFGFVEMVDETAARKATVELDGTMIEGRPIKVSEAKPKPETKSDDGIGRNYNNSRSYNQNRY